MNRFSGVNSVDYWQYGRPSFGLVLKSHRISAKECVREFRGRVSLFAEELCWLASSANRIPLGQLYAAKNHLEIQPRCLITIRSHLMNSNIRNWENLA
jgi:hypothetical protein